MRKSNSFLMYINATQTNCNHYAAYYLWFSKPTQIVGVIVFAATLITNRDVVYLFENNKTVKAVHCANEIRPQTA